MSRSKKGWFVWDKDSESCPNGHLKSECMKLVEGRKGTGNWHPVCMIRKREGQRAAALRRRSGGTAKRPPGRPRKDVDVTLEDASVVKPKYDGGTSLSGTANKVLIQLVCGHIVQYERAKLSYNCGRPNFEEMLYCTYHHEWMKVHKVGAMYAEDQAMVLYPLEVAAKKACFLESEFFRVRSADKIRSEKSIPFYRGWTSLSAQADNSPQRVVSSLEDLRLPHHRSFGGDHETQQDTNEEECTEVLR